MTPMTLTDAQIREAFDRRARVAVPEDLRLFVFDSLAGRKQRRGWIGRPQWWVAGRRTRRALLALAAIALLVAVTLAIAFVGNRTQLHTAPVRGLAFVSSGNLWVADPDGRNARLVWDLPDPMIAGRVTWVDDNTILLQEVTDGVYVVDMRTSTPRELSSVGAFVGISPDHRLAAVSIQRPDRPHIVLFDIASDRIDADVVVRTPVVPPADAQFSQRGLTGGPHQWSPDGLWLLGQGRDTDQSATSGWIYRLDLETGEIGDLATQLCCGLSNPHPVLAPDGSRVVYVDYHQATKDEPCDFRCGTLWSLDPVSLDRVRLTAEAGSETGPVLSPDGAWIAFGEYLPPGYDLSIVRVDGSLRHPLTSIGDVYTPVDNSEPYDAFVWDADGGGLTFLRGKPDQPEWPLWHVSVADGQLQRLGTFTASEFAR